MKRLQLHSRKRTLSLPKSTVSPKQTYVKKRAFKVIRKSSVFSLTLDSNYKTHSTLKIYRNGQFTDYNGPRKADGIISYLVK